VKAKSPALPGAGWADALLGHVIDKGDLGVQLFFVISGFILALPFAAHFLEGRPPRRLGSYYLRRLTRLEPPYFINLALIVTLLVFVNHQPAGELLPNLFASAGYVSYLTMGHPSLINSVAWSLEVEVQFYLLAPVLSLVFCIGSASARRATIAVAMLAGVILQQGLGFTEKTLLGNLQYFMAGFFLCDLYLSRWKRNLSARWGWDLGALLAWIAMGAAHRLGAAWAWSLPVLILIAYCGAFRGAIFAKVLGNPWPVTIGGMCYTIYLYHYFLISLAGRFTAHWLPTASYPLAVLVQFFLITPIVLAGCGVLFVIF
jgi:peptidoglycan/LPS O-acetylase OafA/YrhL